MRIALISGEPSGDRLAAALLSALGSGCTVRGVGGPLSQAQGLLSLIDPDELAVMGLSEVLRHLPRLLKRQRQLRQTLYDWQPDVFIGIDSPDFNLPIARWLRTRGVKTMHIVSPSVWAWRKGRLRGIARAIEAMLVLFPFELDCYREQGIPAQYIGHPLADQLPTAPSMAAARQVLPFAAQGQPLIALLPGSRQGEIQRLGPVLIEAAVRFQARHLHAHFICPLPSSSLIEQFEQLRAGRLERTLHCGVWPASTVLTAADATLMCSGTATLEALLCHCPMVVAYRLNASSAWLARRLVTTPYFALPNLLADAPLVPEFFQESVTPDALADALSAALEPTQREGLRQRAAELHALLRCDAAMRAATAVRDVLAGRHHDW